MIEKGQIVELTIEDMSAEGQGIGRIRDGEHSGMVVFAADTVVGDRAMIRLTKVKKNLAFGRLEEMLEESPLRSAEFDCPYFEEGCGGCPYAKLDYEAQLEIKQKQVRGKLERIAGLEDPLIRPMIGMREEDNEGLGCFRYRGKARFPVSTGGIITRKGGIVESVGAPAIGFYRAKTHEVVDCGDCYLQSMAAIAAADALRRFMEEDNITGFDPKWQKGLMRHMIVKTAFGTGEVMVILVINGKGIPGAPKLIGMLDDAIYSAGYSLESVVININKSGGKNVETGDKYVTIAGKPTITDEVGGLRYEISPASFYQVNHAQMRRLYDQVRDYCSQAAAAGPDRKPVLLDLYCGIGSIGLYCADLAEMVIGIESVEEAVTDANRNAVINGIVNARYICGKAEKILPVCVETVAGAAGKPGQGPLPAGVDEDLRAYINRADIAILDPPRAGCRPELLEAVAASGADYIIYVSCDPATLARDVLLLREMGYRFEEAVPVDMFPHTGHVETVALIQKRKGD